MELVIAHIHPELLNLYGDSGNIITLKARLSARGIDAKIIEYGIEDSLDFSSTDIIYIGGGTDREQLTSCKKLCSFKAEFKSYSEDGGTILAVAAGYPLLGQYYEQNSEKIEALGLLDMYTEQGDDRTIGNVILESDLIGTTIVGFENHSGRTYINNHSPLGKVRYGYGNSGKKDYEGAVDKNIIGTYLHGPLLPKNPILTDYILKNALLRKYGKAELEPLDDTMEMMAHDYILNRFLKK